MLRVVHSACNGKVRKDVIFIEENQPCFTESIGTSFFGFRRAAYLSVKGCVVYRSF